MEDRQMQKEHRLQLFNREEGTVSGVKDVKSFDEKLILLSTDWGTITIKGEALHVSQLNLQTGDVKLDGRVDSITYSDKGAVSRRGESLLGRMFR